MYLFRDVYKYGKETEEADAQVQDLIPLHEVTGSVNKGFGKPSQL